LNLDFDTAFNQPHHHLPPAPQYHEYMVLLFSSCCRYLSLSVLTAIFQVNLGQPVFIEAKDDGSGGDNWTTGAISRAKLQSNHHHQETNI